MIDVSNDPRTDHWLEKVSRKEITHFTHVFIGFLVETRYDII